MRRYCHWMLLSIAFLLSAFVCRAQYDGKRTSDIMVGPWIQAVSETSFTVVWTTNLDAVSWVEIAPDDGSHFYEKDRPKYYQTVLGKRPIGKLHRVTVSGLEPGTTYRYRIMEQAVITAPGDNRPVFGIPAGNDPFRMKPYTVTTLDSQAECCDFQVVNDIHAKDSIFRCLMASVPEDKPDFVIFNGDMLSAMNSEEQMVDGYLRSANELFAHEIPFFFNRGNHEGRGQFSYRFLDYFPSSNGQAYYMVRQGPAALLFLDCGEDKPDSHESYFGLNACDQYRAEEARWLKDAVQSKHWTEAPVRIVIFHVPPMKEGGWHVNQQVNEHFMPILNEAGVDLMISGHIHRYYYSEKGDRVDAFPIIINGCTEKHVFHVTADGITAKRVDASGAVLREYEFKK